MIKNDKQYKITRAWIARFEDSLFQLKNSPPKQQPSWAIKAQRESIQAQIKDLSKEIAEYDALKSGKHTPAPLDSVVLLPQLLIQWRIARNWTQQELAERIGVAAQQVQRYEQTDYSTATLSVVSAIASVLMTPGASVARRKSAAQGVKPTAQRTGRKIKTRQSPAASKRASS